MNTAFKILPVEKPTRPHQLLIEIGWEHVSLLYFSKAPYQVNGLCVFQFSKNITAIDLADELQAFFQLEQLPAVENVYVCYDFKETTLLPAGMYKENMLAEILNVIFPVNNRASNFAELIKGLEIAVAYQVDNRIESVINQQFPSADLQHSLALRLPSLVATQDLFYCIVYQYSIRVILFKNGELQIAQLFDYATPTDVAYHLLNACTQHGISPEQVTLTLSGLIDKKSNLYDELYRYFMTIELSQNDADVEIAQAITQYPEHFFSHLISLGKCVS